MILYAIAILGNQQKVFLSYIPEAFPFEGDKYFYNSKNKDPISLTSWNITSQLLQIEEDLGEITDASITEEGDDLFDALAEDIDSFFSQKSISSFDIEQTYRNVKQQEEVQIATRNWLRFEFISSEEEGEEIVKEAVRNSYQKSKHNPRKMIFYQDLFEIEIEDVGFQFQMEMKTHESEF